MEQLLWKTVWQFLKTLNKELPHDPAISLLDTYPKEQESRYPKPVHTYSQQHYLQWPKGENNPNVYQQMHAEANHVLFFTHAKDYYSVIKRFSRFVATCINTVH